MKKIDITKKIIGLKKVAGATRSIKPGYKGVIVFDTKKYSIRFEGTWRDWCSLNIELKDDEVIVDWVCRPKTMREIAKTIYIEYDYDAYIQLIHEETD